jgi:hypothetical protein
MGVTNGALLAYWYSVLCSDGDYGTERMSGRIVRQLFMLIVGLAGLVFIVWGAASGTQVLLRMLLDRMTESAGSTAMGTSWWQNALASSLTQVIVGAWLAYTNRAQWRDLVAVHAEEGQAALRRVYLYAGVVLGAVATLTPAALLLRELLLMVFGDSTGTPADLLEKVITPISFVPVGLVIWLWHWSVLRKEAAAFGESQEGASVRRIYYYLMAATGLALLWVGSVELLHALLDTLLTGLQGPTYVWHEPLANGLSLLAVGAPIWVLHWRSVQRVALQTNAAGSAERDALMRKIYLYGVALIGALIILFQLAQVIYKLLLALMGDVTGSLLSPQTAHQLADCLVAGVIWGVHLLAIRTDAQVEKATPRAVVPAEAVAADSTPAERRALLEQKKQQLEQELEQVNRALAEL